MCHDSLHAAIRKSSLLGFGAVDEWVVFWVGTVDELGTTVSKTERSL